MDKSGAEEYGGYAGFIWIIYLFEMIFYIAKRLPI